MEQDLDKYWKTAVSTLREGIMIVDASGCIASTDGAPEAMTGYSRGDLVGRKCPVLNRGIFRVSGETGRSHWNALSCDSGQPSVSTAYSQYFSRRIIFLQKSAYGFEGCRLGPPRVVGEGYFF
jgi:hypothetical protein